MGVGLLRLVQLKNKKASLVYSPITWTSTNGYSYALLKKTNLVVDTTWSTNTTGIPGGGGSATVTVPADQDKRFFGVISED